MADGIPAFEIPPGTIPIVRSFTATDNYQPAASKRFIVLAAWVSVTQPAAGAAIGTAVIECHPEFDSAIRTLCGVNFPATNSISSSSNTAAVTPVANLGNSGAAGADQVRLTITGLAGATIVGGFSGYEEAK